MDKDFFSEEIQKLGQWELTLNSQLDVFAYMSYLNVVKKLKDSGEWIKRESTFVMNQKYFFEFSKTGSSFYNKAKNILRNKKINKLCQLNQEKIFNNK